MEEVYIAGLLGVMVAISFAEVVARYVFSSGFSWSLEAVGLCFAWLVFIGMSYGVRTHAHIGVDAVVKKFPPNTQRYIAMLVALLCVVYALIIAYGGWVYMTKIYNVGIVLQEMPIKQWIPRTVMPIGFALLAYRFLEVFWGLATGKDMHLLGDEAKDALKLKTE